MDNYKFFTKWILDQKPDQSVRVLDYGCGAGKIVKELRKLDVNAFGCDVFYEGGDYSELIGADLFENGVVKKMDGNAIPFDSASFDFIINNQVMEHVEDLDSVMAEIQRVLKPGGKILSLFPDKGVWREAHCGIPFIHWFPKNINSRAYYAAAFRMLGFGYHKETKSVMQWSKDFCKWIDQWTFYRNKQEIEKIYQKYLCNLEYIEDYWLKLRLGNKGSLVRWLPSFVRHLIVRKFGGMVFIARKPV